MDAKHTFELLDSVRPWFSASHELELRIREQAEGLTCPESRLLRPLRLGSRLLDIGCGAGRTVFALADAGHDVTGMDVSDALVRAARSEAQRRGVRAAFQVCDPVAIAFRNVAFDAAVLLKTCCYVPGRRTRIRWLEEIARVLRARHEIRDELQSAGALLPQCVLN